jgi:hypothetical protein
MNNPLFAFFLAAIAFSGCRKQVGGYVRPDFDPQPTQFPVLADLQSASLEYQHL